MKRYHEEQHIIERRYRAARDGKWSFGKFLSQKGRFRKRKPLDCGNVRCGICHYTKFYQRDDRLKTSDLSMKEQLAEL